MTKGAWNKAQDAFVKEHFESTLAHFHRYPGVRFTFSLTILERGPGLKPAGLDVLELHIWIKGQLNDYTGFNKLKKDRDPAHDYKSYMAVSAAAMKDVDSLQCNEGPDGYGPLLGGGTERSPDNHRSVGPVVAHGIRILNGSGSTIGANTVWASPAITDSGVTPWNYSHPSWETGKCAHRKVNNVLEELTI